MAEGILFDLAGKLLEGLASLAAKEIALAWGFKEELNKLSTTASAIRAVLRDDEDERNRNNHRVTLWLKELKNVLYDVEDLLDDFSTEVLRRRIMTGNGTVKEVRLFFSKSNQLAYSLKMGHRVKAIRERLDAIAADRANLPASDRTIEPPIEVRERDQTYSFVRSEEIIGRNDDKTKIVQLLLQSEPEENVSIVTIVGIGGLGKTTLSKMVFNDEKLRDHFELKMWVCVSEKFELRVIVEKIIEAATGSKPEKDLQMGTLQNRLLDNINGKKYLLVLDDVWNEKRDMWFELRDLLLGGGRGSWIVITTRSRLVAEMTGNVAPHNLQGLSKSESWSLLKKMTFKEKSREPNDTRLEAIGMEIVEVCKGVPLALKVIGRVLFQHTEAEWLRVKNNIHIYITQCENGIMPILKLSYDHLPSHLKQCFAYCSLIPKDTKFEVEKLIRYWMAQGFIQPLSEDDDLEDVGQEYFKDLLWRSFFQVAEEDDDSRNGKSFTMHDLMHDLACSIAGTEYCITNSKAENVDERTRHVSFEDRLDSLWKIPNTLLKATRVRSFILIEGSSLNQATSDAMMSKFKFLRLLVLRNSDIMRIPHSIGELKHLRNLDLSQNDEIRKLPDSLCRLQDLQTLDLHDCWSLEKLPCKTSRLVSLKHLDIEGCDRLGYMARGLGKLTCLRTLSRFVVGKRGREVGGLKELNELNKLSGSLYILDLQNAGIPEHGSTYLKHKLNLKSLKLWWSCREDDHVKDEMVFESLQPHPNLEELKVSGYPGSKISSWLSSITNLTQLILIGCDKCKHLPPLDHLSSLKLLRLVGLKALEYVSEIGMQRELSSLESTIIFFPSLEKLSINYCPNLKGWWRPDDVLGEASNAQLPCFPYLSYLTISSCPNLTSSMPLVPSVKEMRLIQTRWKPLIQPTMKMNMKMESTTSSSSSSSIFSPFSKLETLVLANMEDVDSLPEKFLQNLTSLSFLRIEKCTNLTSMPEGMRHLTSLKELRITGCSPQLKERCQRDIGVGWPHIAHIPRVQIDHQWIQFVEWEFIVVFPIFGDTTD